MKLFEHKPIYGAAALALVGAALCAQFILSESLANSDPTDIEFVVENSGGPTWPAAAPTQAGASADSNTSDCLVEKIPARTDSKLSFRIPLEIYKAGPESGIRVVANQGAIDSAVSAIRSNLKLAPGTESEGWMPQTFAADYSASGGALSVVLNNASPAEEHALICGPAKTKLAALPSTNSKAARPPFLGS